MSASEEFAHLQAAFDRLADLPRDAREEALQRLDHLSDASRDMLRKMLAVHADMDAMTARRALGALRGVDSAAEMAGRRVGGFVLERELGRGGMGRVFLARRADESVEQRVAIKLIRAEQLDANTLARFRLERQVLALLKHPNIATLLDAGELPDGTPYVAMEYVEGQPLADYARTLDLERRLQLFLEICDAVSCAHRNMVVHRDLKPSNILVDAAGKSRLLDFGIAKPLLPRLGAHEVQETQEAQRFFSPYNVAPEQLRGDAITVACDVYGLGVLLYELLAQAPLFDLAGKDPDAIRRLILETDPPPPSSRGPGLQKLRGDLDAIVLRALRKAPQARYATVDAFAEDVRNWLTGRPVTARKGRAGYRLSKFAGRHRIALSVAAAFAVFLVTAATALWNASQETLRQRDRAVRSLDFLIETFRAADPEKALGEKVTAREVLDQAERSLSADAGMDPSLHAELTGRIAEIKLHLGANKEAEPLLDRALMELPASAEIDTRAGLLDLRARAARQDGDYDRAKLEIAHAFALRPSLRMQAQIEADAIDLLWWSGAKENMRPDVDRALNEIAPQLAPGDPLRWQLITAAAQAETDLDGPATSVRLLEQLFEDQAAPAGDLPYVLRAKLMLGNAYGDVRRLKDAEALLASIEQPTARLYGAKSLAMADWKNAMAAAFDAEKRYADALPLYRAALAIDMEQRGELSPSVANTVFNIAGAEAGAEQWDAAQADFRKSIELAAKIYPDTNENIEIFRVTYAMMLNRLHRFTEAKAVLRQVAVRAARDPEFKDDEVDHTAQLCDALADYGLNPTPEHQQAFERLAQLPQNAGHDARDARDDQIEVARQIGLIVKDQSEAPAAGHQAR